VAKDERVMDAARPGTVYLVGAGPGDPKLITVRGLEVLRASDVIVYDRLVHPALIQQTDPHADRIYAGKRPGHHALAQIKINALLIDRARAGSIVTRLKGGDPFVFGRGGEECQALSAAGVPFEIVPGVTAAVAVAAYAGIPVTHRQYASAFAVVTGHTCRASQLDWTALAHIPALVVMMGLRTLPQTARRLIAHGAGAKTPAAVVCAGSTTRQLTVVVGTLETIAERAHDAGARPPAVLIVGEVVRLRQTLRWYATEVIGEARLLTGNFGSRRTVAVHHQMEAGALERDMGRSEGESLAMGLERLWAPPARRAK